MNSSGQDKSTVAALLPCCLGKKVCKLVFKHLKQLVARTEPAEPLITVIYKPDSTLMGRQNLPSPSFLCSSSLLTSVHLLSHLTSPPHSPALSLVSISPALRPSYFLPVSLSAFLSCPITHTLLYHFEREKRRARGKLSRRIPSYTKKKCIWFFFVRQANTPLGLALGLVAVWEWHETKQQITTAPQTSLDILRRLSCTQACLDECHRVGTAASK